MFLSLCCIPLTVFYVISFPVIPMEMTTIYIYFRSSSCLVIFFIQVEIIHPELKSELQKS